MNIKQHFISFFFIFCSFSTIFIAGNATYKSLLVGQSVRQLVCPSIPLYFCVCHRQRDHVGPLVCRSIPLNFFGLFELFEGRIAQALVSYGCSFPCPNHFCPCPTHYCPCPTARDRGSRVYSLVLLTCCLVNFFHVF